MADRGFDCKTGGGGGLGGGTFGERVSQFYSRSLSGAGSVQEDRQNLAYERALALVGDLASEGKDLSALSPGLRWLAPGLAVIAKSTRKEK